MGREVAQVGSAGNAGARSLHWVAQWKMDLSELKRGRSVSLSGGSGSPRRARTTHLGGGPQEEGIAVAPDGRLFVTAVASKQSAVRTSTDPGGDRSISLEGCPPSTRSSPRMARKLLYRNLHSSSFLDASELLATDLESGLTERRSQRFYISLWSYSPPTMFLTGRAPGRRIGRYRRGAPALGLFRWDRRSRLKPFLTSTDSWVPP